MKHQFLRRTGASFLALFLALTMVLSLTAPAWANDPDTTDSSGTETGTTDPNETPSGTESPDPDATETTPGTGGGGGDDGNVPVTGVTLDRDTLELAVGETGTLTAAITPSNATDKTVTWTSSSPSVATVSDNGTVTALSEGATTIKATAGGASATCVVTVKLSVTGISFLYGDETKWSDTDTWEVEVRLAPNGVGLDGGTISWDIQPTGNTDPDSRCGIMQHPTNSLKGVVAGDTAPGRYTVTATYTRADGTALPSATKIVEVSGITLTRTSIAGEDAMHVGENRVIAVANVYGYADDGTTTVDWMSSDSSIVSVMGGNLTAWKLGTAVITATKNGYSAECEVEVAEDKDIIAGPYSATTSKPLVFGTIYNDLNTISHNRTRKRDAEGNVVSYSDLNYITNVSVPTSQGTLYCNYISEADTGMGVGSADRFALKSSGAIRSLDTLYFVPKQGFSGIAEITFNGWAKDGTSFPGTIKVAVGVSTDKDGNVVGDSEVVSINYGTQAGEPVWFRTSDFNAFCQSKNGRGVNYVTFNLPQPSQGVLYYNYVGGSGTPVSTSTQFSRFGRYTMDDVCFVPNAAFTGDVEITFRGEDSAGTAIKDGKVVVSVTASSSSNDPTNVYLFGERGKPVALQSNLFNDACRAAINDTLAYVTFKLPDPDEGTLYYNYQNSGSYDSRATATTRYYYSGVPGISGVSFVPAAGATGRTAIPYTGYGSAGTSFSGTLYISWDEADRSTIRYTVSKSGSVTFSTGDFSAAGLYEMGVGVDYVVFDLPDIDTGLGALYYNYQSSSNYGRVYSGAYYYLSPTYNWQYRLGLISFRAKDAAGSVTIPYTAYYGTGSSQKSFKGNVVIQVGSLTPADVKISCYNSENVRMPSSALTNACRPVMTEDRSYIEITGVPDAEKGHLYLNYYGFGTGTAVKEGDRFYTAGSPSITQLSFVPRAGFSGEAEITYIGYGYNGSEKSQAEQVSGRIVVNVSRSTASRYFNDMGGHVWAADSVDYLVQDGTVEGIGGSRYNPAGTMTKGDFTLMLVRAYGLTAGGSASFNDVPANSYYADAIRIAAVLGIAGGSNGYYNPKTPITRQDAMVMIFNTLKATGRNVTNGLTADFSVYRDAGQIDPNAREAMGSLLQMGIIQGNGNGYLRPLGQLSRADSAMLLHTIMTL